MNFNETSDCSVLSYQSDDAKSSVSSLSGVSNYQDEFAELRHSIDYSKYLTTARVLTPTREGCSTPVNNDSGCDVHYDYEIANSSSQTQKENYENDSYSEIKMKYNWKIGTLLRSNKQLTEELRNANEQIERLLKNRNEASAVADKSFIQLEKKYHDMSLQIIALEAKLSRSFKEKSETEIACNELKLELGECKTNIRIKNECIRELKVKISHQFTKIQSLIRNNHVTQYSLNEVHSELEHFRNDQNWYKQQFHQLQNDKKLLTENFTKCKLEVSSSKKYVDSLHLEVAVWKNKCEILRLGTLRDKDKFHQGLKELNSVSEKKLNVDNSDVSTDKSLLNFYQSSIQDLQREISFIRDVIKEQDEAMKKLNKENSEFISKCVTFQKISQCKDYSIQELEYAKDQLVGDLSSIRDQYLEKSAENSSLKSNLILLEREVLAQREEKSIIENSIRTVREQFSAFKIQYDTLKKDLNEKNKQVLLLENEKQKLFMNNNWKVCELERVKEKELKIEQLRIQIALKDQNLLNKVEYLENELKKQEQTNNTLLVKIETISEDHSEELKRYENVLIQYQEVVKKLEKQMSILEHQKNKIDTVEVKMEDTTILRNQLKEKDLCLLELHKKCEDLTKQIEVLNADKMETAVHEVSRDVSYTDDYPNRPVISNKIILSENSNRRCVKMKLSSKIYELENRIKYLLEKVEKCSALLETFRRKYDDFQESQQNKEFKVMLQVKELELKEKQTKYEKNYRTLLRKVKEHMRGRHSAEKQLKYLQNLYSTLSEENNSLKLSISLGKTNEKNYMDENVRTKILEFQGSYEKKCLEYDTLNKKLKTDISEDLDIEKIHIQNLILEKENMNVDLLRQIQELLSKIEDMGRTRNNLSNKIEELLIDKSRLSNEKAFLEEKIPQLNSTICELGVSLEIQKQQQMEKIIQVESLNRIREEIENKMECMVQEIEVLNFSLQNKAEEIKLMEEKQCERDNYWLARVTDLEKNMQDLKKHLGELQMQIGAVNSEKHFLRRLCKDLKLALKSQVNYVEVLKEKLQYFSAKHENTNSPRNFLHDIQMEDKYNEQYVNELLQQYKTPMQDKPFADIQNSLDTLRKEIFTIQEQILKKNSEDS